MELTQQVQNQNINRGDEGDSGSVYIGGRNVMITMNEEAKVTIVDDGCTDIKTECYRTENQRHEQVLSNSDARISSVEDKKSGLQEDERINNPTIPPTSSDSVSVRRESHRYRHHPQRQLRRRQEQQQQQLRQRCKKIGGTDSGTTCNGLSGRMKDDHPSDQLLKQLQAELLDALLKKEKVLLENKILREKLKAAEKEVRELTKKLKKLRYQPVLTQGRKKNEKTISKTKTNALTLLAKSRTRTQLRAERTGSRKLSKTIDEVNYDLSVNTPDSVLPVVDVNVVTDVAESHAQQQLPPLSDWMGDKDYDVDDNENDGNINDKGDDNADGDNVEDIRGEETKTSVLSIVKKKRDKLPPVCHLCSLVCSSYTQLKQHTRTFHEGEKPFKCSLCDKSYVHRSKLKEHSRLHSGEKPYLCNVCGKSFAMSSSWLSHHAIHTGQKDFHCSYCSKSFSQRGNLATHMRIHLGQKNFHCSVCSKTFVQKGQLAAHMRVHTGHAPFQCSVCDKAFKQQGDLAQHHRIHSGNKPYQCPTCGKMFNSSTSLKRHTRGHSNVKTFQCPICPKAFKEGNYLTRHMTIHSGELPYSCPVCGQKFRLKYSLTRHMDRHNGARLKHDPTLGIEHSAADFSTTHTHHEGFYAL